jgi:hypothetical protein
MGSRFLAFSSNKVLDAIAVACNQSERARKSFLLTKIWRFWNGEEQNHKAIVLATPASQVCNTMLNVTGQQHSSISASKRWRSSST